MPCVFIVLIVPCQGFITPHPPPPPPPRAHGVSIPESLFHVPATDLVDLQQEVNPLAESKNYGIELYESVLNFLEQRSLTNYYFNIVELIH